ncbi:MAG: periplasmic heavy metal sensor [candidate division KSB1 bacterium]|nr:periplasmic heavy metal sensor [candidate division KSB1 bacterium]MDZ7295219.1 periplasmic heavy metal sensor [candidate division KSB1 bacterium]MDZ7379036.1 periplasmic heavy metal sensor [candidate division KSB1 bacterium]MDZ7384678.1 periplasmic heavy metal sensor [candidate division KSB1 bacterium]MDZ7393068.1 periplasmic heavy metal sensor [candidate division KSB1 bacterium]
MMRNKWMFLALVFSLTVNVVAIVTLAVFWLTRPKEKPWRPPRWSSETRVRFHPETDEVVGKMVQDYFARAQREKAALRATRLKLVELLRQEVPDTVKIMATIDELARHQAELERITVRHLLGLKPRIGRERLDFLIRMFEQRAMEHRVMMRGPMEPGPPPLEGETPGAPRGQERVAPFHHHR